MARYEGINRNYEAGIWNKEEGPSPEQKKAENASLLTARYLWNFLSGMVSKHKLQQAA